MKVNITTPSLDERKTLLKNDVLRFKKVEEYWSQQTEANFTKDLLRRITLARFDPRITESCIERIVLMPTQIDFPLLLLSISQLPWPRAATVIFDFARQLVKKKNLIHLFYPSIKNEGLYAQAKTTFESFYIDLYNPSSHFTQKAIQQNPRTWDRHGYWAVSEPYSKEILGHCGFGKKLIRVASNKRTLQSRMIEALRQKKKWASLSDILEDAEIGLSQRQALRILNSIPNLRKTGSLKGARYKLAKS